MAGSGNATSEMRLVMIDIVDQALLAYPLVRPTLFVDDLSAEVVAKDAMIKRQLVGFILTVCKQSAGETARLQPSQAESL